MTARIHHLRRSASEASRPRSGEASSVVVITAQSSQIAKAHDLHPLTILDHP